MDCDYSWRRVHGGTTSHKENHHPLCSGLCNLQFGQSLMFDTGQDSSHRLVYVNGFFLLKSRSRFNDRLGLKKFISLCTSISRTASDSWMNPARRRLEHKNPILDHGSNFVINLIIAISWVPKKRWPCQEGGIPRIWLPRGFGYW